jgi:hypothetical protein
MAAHHRRHASVRDLIELIFIAPHEVTQQRHSTAANSQVIMITGAVLLTAVTIDAVLRRGRRTSER